MLIYLMNIPISSIYIYVYMYASYMFVWRKASHQKCMLPSGIGDVKWVWFTSFTRKTGAFPLKSGPSFTKRNNKSTTSSPNPSRNCTHHIFCWRFVWKCLEVSSRKLGMWKENNWYPQHVPLKSHNGGQEVALDRWEAMPSMPTLPHLPSVPRKFCKA